jgi:maltodextrin utilization protein YvdJ
MQTRAVNVQFGISLTVLIGLVVVKTLISLVNFYIVKADTSFLLYLTDIDRL